jgi:hypothetical protein
MHDTSVKTIRTYEITNFTWIWNEPMKLINLWCCCFHQHQNNFILKKINLWIREEKMKGKKRKKKTKMGRPECLPPSSQI